MKSLINSRYTDAQFIASWYQDMQNIKPIWYMVIDDFIDPLFFQSCMKELDTSDINILSHDTNDGSQNKTIFSAWKKSFELYKFFESADFEQYLSSFFWSQLKREFYIDKAMYEKIWITEPGLIGQLYEKWDFYNWHTDGSSQWVSLWAFTYYFSGYNPNEKEFSSGWELELWKWEWWNIDSYETIQPMKNRLVMLLYSNDAFHRVTPVTSVDLRRISIQATLIKNN